MNLHLVLATALLTIALPAATASNEGVALGINHPSETVCTGIESIEAAAGLAESCATATLSGRVVTCWNDGTYNCQVEFTATLTVGPLVCAHFASDAGDLSFCWSAINDDANTRSHSGPRVTFTDVPRDGVTPYLGRKATLQVSPPSAYPTNHTTWDPEYVFPRDTTLDDDGCSSGSVSASSTMISLVLVSQPVGMEEQVVVEPLNVLPLRARVDTATTVRMETGSICG